MGKANTQQTSYTAGEVSPLIRGRPDIAKFQSGGEQVENFIVRPQGPQWRRPGTQWVDTINQYNASAGLIKEFIFSSTESYLIEFTEQRLLVRNNDGTPVTTGAAATIVSVASSLGAGFDGDAEVTTSGVHGFSTGNTVSITGSSVITYNGTWGIEVVSGTVFVLTRCKYNGTATGTATRVVSLVTDYPASILNELSFAQSADTMFICHKLYPPRTLTRTSSTSWSWTQFLTIDGPYLDYNKTNTRMTISAITDTATLTGNASFGATTPFIAGDVGDWVEYFHDNEWYLALITAVTSTTVATVDIVDQVMVGIDPSTGLTAPSIDNTLPVARTPLIGPQRVHPLAPPILRRQLRPNHATPGISPDESAASPLRPHPTIDPHAVIAVPGSITSTHSGTFSVSDVGRYIRVASQNWRIIATVTNSYTATFTAGAAPAGGVINAASGNMKVYTYPTQAVTLNQNSRTISATLTASAATFASTDVGRHIRLNFQGRWVYAKISAYTSSTVVTVRLYESFPRHFRDAGRLANDGITDIWRFGAWYGTAGTGNYPAQVTFHEQRLVFAGSPVEPQTLWFSRPQDFNKFSPSEPDGSVLDDNAITVTLASSKVNGITWLQSSKVLLVGTIGGEWQGRAASSITEPITPTNLAFTEETTHGSTVSVQPVKIGSAVLFLQRSGQRLRELTYNFELDGWASRDLTIASEHILREGTKAIKLVYQNEPHGIVWCLLSSGDVAGLTYQREQEVAGWHYHRIGGSGVVESIAAIPNSTGSETTLFAIVRRTIDSRTCRFLEKLASDDYPDSASDKTGFNYVDSLVTETVSGSGSTWTKLGHLPGMTVTILKNGVSQGTAVVSAAGGVTVSYANNDVLTGGLAYTSKFKSLPVQGGSPYGSSDMGKKRIHKMFLRVLNSINAKIGPDEGSLQLKTFDGAVGSELLKTGDVELHTNLHYNSDGVFHLHVTDPYPLILLSHVAQLHANE